MAETRPQQQQAHPSSSAGQLNHAIDKLTAAAIDVQWLRRRLRSGTLDPGDALVAESLHRIQAALDDLGQLLQSLRDFQSP